MKKIINMRGLPGAGKSTKAHEIVKQLKKDHPNKIAYICSADEFFVDPVSGEYKFDAKKIGMAHAWCRGNAHAALSIGIDLLIVDNTASCKWEYQPYVSLAEQFGYEFETCMVGYLDVESIKAYTNRGKHGVPLDVIRRMAQRFE